MKEHDIFELAPIEKVVREMSWGMTTLHAIILGLAFPSERKAFFLATTLEAESKGWSPTYAQRLVLRILPGGSHARQEITSALERYRERRLPSV